MKKFKVYIPIVLSLLIVISFNSYNLYKSNKVNTTTNLKSGEIAPIKGIGFALEHNGEFVQNINKEDIQEYIITVSNASDSDYTLTLTVLGGYKQQTLLLDNDKIGNYKFRINAKENLKLPIRLEKDIDQEDIYNYIFTFIPENEKNTVDYKYSGFTFSRYVENSNLNNELPINKIEKDNIDSSNCLNIMHRDIYKKKLEEKNIKLNEKDNKVEVPLIFGGGDSEEYLIYCLADGKQVMINDSYALIYKSNKTNCLIEDNIKVDLSKDNNANSIIFFIVDKFKEPLKSNINIEYTSQYMIKH